jgi:antitoxin ParD1/3/4
MIKKGHYANASEVMRAGLRALEKDEQENRAKIAALRAALQAGEESGIAEDGVFYRLDRYVDKLAARKVDVA